MTVANGFEIELNICLLFCEMIELQVDKFCEHTFLDNLSFDRPIGRFVGPAKSIQRLM